MTALNHGAWLRRFRPAPQVVTRLVCFPHAGASATYFLPVAKALGVEIDVLAVQYPGRQDRRHEPVVDDVQKLADAVVGELSPWLDKPLALFGHSLGASVGYEVALRLEAAGIAPSVLFASGRRAPSTIRNELVHKASDEQLIATLEGSSGTDPLLLREPEFLRSMLPALRGDYKAAETYRGGGRLACPIVVLTGDRDPQVSWAEAEAWRAHTSGRFAHHVYRGDHFFLNQYVPEVLSLLRAQLLGA